MPKFSEMTIIDFIKEKMDCYCKDDEDGLIVYHDPFCKEVAEKLSPYLIGYVVRYLENNAWATMNIPENKIAINRLSEMIENAFATHKEKELNDAQMVIDRLQNTIDSKNVSIQSLQKRNDELYKNDRDSKTRIKELEQKLSQAQELIRKHDIISLEDLYSGKAFE